MRVRGRAPVSARDAVRRGGAEETALTAVLETCHYSTDWIASTIVATIDFSPVV